MEQENQFGHEKGMAVVVRCVDVRYCNDSARSKLPVGFEITGAGASLRFNESSAFAQEVVGQVNLLQSAGKDIRRIVIVDHFCANGGHGCAAYGDDDSRTRHEANLYKAAEQLKNEFPNLAIELMLHDIDAENIEDIVIHEVIAQPVSIEGAQA